MRNEAEQYPELEQREGKSLLPDSKLGENKPPDASSKR